MMEPAVRMIHIMNYIWQIQIQHGENMVAVQMEHGPMQFMILNWDIIK